MPDTGKAWPALLTRVTVSERTVCAVAAAFALAASALYGPESLPRVGVCFFNRMTGLPCPGCGLTRSFCAISHGRLGDAWAYNPFGLLLYALAMLLVLRPFLVWRWPGYCRWEDRLRASRAFRFAPLCLATAMLAFGVWRILCFAF